MLGKLLKYDLKWVYKVVVVFYVLSLVFSLIGRGLGCIENSAIFSVVSQISFGFAIIMMVSSLINCIMRLWARFIKNLYKDESYLTHTLPVEKKTIYVSKVISSLITIFTTAMAIIVCLFICYYSEEHIEYIKSILDLAASTYNTTVMNLLLLISIVITLQMIFVVIVGYFGIILGFRSNKNKIVRTIIIGFALYMVTQVISICLLFIAGLLNSNIMNLIKTNDIISIEAIKVVMYGVIGIYCIFIILYYTLGKRAFEKGVNVE